jgi:Family of unknown function (DUF5908)
MPIEIKELHIKVKIEEEKSTFQNEKGVNQIQLDALKSELIKECTAKILEKLKEREER